MKKNKKIKQPELLIDNISDEDLIICAEKILLKNGIEDCYVEKLKWGSTLYSPSGDWVKEYEIIYKSSLLIEFEINNRYDVGIMEDKKFTLTVPSIYFEQILENIKDEQE